MPYPTTGEFRGLLSNVALPEIVEKYLFRGTPFDGVAYVFRDDPPADRQLRMQLAQNLAVRPENVTVVGSAKLGFSLSPDNFSAPFSPASDVDVIVIDAASYDRIWHCLLEWHYPLRGRLHDAEWRWAKDRREDLYWGWIYPNRIRFRQFLTFPRALRPLRDFRTRWFAAFQMIGGHPLLSKLTVSGRLYRTWDHALFYHVDSLRRVKASLAVQRGS
jgi:hypothetical protein